MFSVCVHKASGTCGQLRVPRQLKVPTWSFKGKAADRIRMTQSSLLKTASLMLIKPDVPPSPFTTHWVRTTCSEHGIKFKGQKDYIQSWMLFQWTFATLCYQPTTQHENQLWHGSSIHKFPATYNLKENIFKETVHSSYANYIVLSVTFYPHTSARFCPKHCAPLLPLFSPPVPLTHGSHTPHPFFLAQEVWEILENSLPLTTLWDWPTVQVYLPGEKRRCLPCWRGEAHHHWFYRHPKNLPKKCKDHLLHLLLLSMPGVLTLLHDCAILASPSRLFSTVNKQLRSLSSTVRGWKQVCSWQLPHCPQIALFWKAIQCLKLWKDCHFTQGTTYCPVRAFQISDIFYTSTFVTTLINSTAAEQVKRL